MAEAAQRYVAAAGGPLRRLTDQRRHQAGPAGLVAGAQAGAVVAVEVLVEEEVVAEVRIVLPVDGSDAATNPLAYPKAGWGAFRRLPLSDAEFHVIANNVASYMRDLPNGRR